MAYPITICDQVFHSEHDSGSLFTEARGMDYLARVKLGKLTGDGATTCGEVATVRLAAALAFHLSREVFCGHQ